MTKLSNSFVFYMKNLDIMEALNGFDELDDDGIDALFEGSGLKDAQKMVSRVTDNAKQTAQTILWSIGKNVEEKYKFKISSRIPTIKENWCIECWMYSKRPETGKGYVLSIQICSKGDGTTEGIGFLSCSISDKRKKHTALLEKIFSENIKEEYDDIFEDNEWLILETVILEEDSEEKIIEDFMVKLSEVLTQDNLTKLFAKP
ncbi:MAG TPA: hypothetical protein PK102_06275 [bacterium]|nr:hypothetical protein [bacterium]